MKVCIGITTFNRAEILRKAIRSAMEQDYPQKEIVVVDDASTDGTPELQAEFPNVRWHRFETSQGYRAARNLMMSETDAELFCSLDDDSWFTSSDGLRRGVELFETAPELAAVGFEILDQGNPVGRTVVRAVPSNMFIGCGHLLRLSAARQVGLYHDLPGDYGGEEKDLSIRLLDAGFDVVRLNGVHVWHDKTFQTRDVPGQHLSGVSNDLWLTFTRAPMGMLIWMLPAKFLSHLRFALGFGLRRLTGMSEFDQQIRSDHGRFVFLSSAVMAIGAFMSSAVLRFDRRRPVRAATYRAFIIRGRR